jgi:hypothetical protein
MRRLLLVVLVLLSVPARADDPVLDDSSRGELVTALKEAAATQHVCYGYDLAVDDNSDGAYSGAWRASSLGVGVDAATSSTCKGTVVLHASITYTSDSSESEDSASWSITSSLGPPYTEDLERLGLQASDLLDDSKSEITLFNAVLALPGLTAAAGLAPAIELDSTPDPAPPDARPTDHPGGDWWRENGAAALVLLGVLVAAGIWASTTTPTGHRLARRVWRALKTNS